MNEVDIYLKLIDEREANRILKIFNQSVLKENIKLKIIKIRKIIKGQIKINLKTISPFNEIIKFHRLEFLDNLSDTEFLNFLQEYNNDIPEYKKFSNLLLRFGEDSEKYIDKISNNIINGRKIFDLGAKFNEEKELLNYLDKKIYNKDNTYLYTKIKSISEILKNLEIIKENTEEIKLEYKDAINLYNDIKLKTINESILLRINYLSKNIDNTRILNNKILLDTIEDIFFVLIDSDLFRHIIQIQDNKKIINELKNKIKYQKNELENIEKFYKNKFKKELSEFNILKIQYKELESKYKEIKLTKQYMEQSIKQLNYEREKLENKRLRDNLYYEYAFGSAAKEEYKCTFIYSMEINIVKKIYPEVNFIYKDNWKNKIRKNSILYVQQQGITTKMINELKSYCNSKDIKMSLISIYNEKMLIEKLAILKNKGEF